MLTMAADYSWHVVLIDDESDIRDVMSVTLQDAGYRVHAAADGPSGLSLCERHQPQIVITDNRMPGMDGIQVLETLKKRQPDIEVIVATAFGEMELAIRALQLDASDFITKPINDEALHLALRRAKDRYTVRKQLADYTSLLEKENAETSQQLMQSLAFQRNLIENSMDGILACDADDRVVTFNRSMEKISGYTRKQALHRMTLPEFFRPDELHQLKQGMAGDKYGGRKRLYLYETTLIGESERQIPVQLSAVTLALGHRKSGLVCFFRDLREIRALEREVEDQARILHQDKMMAMGKLAASVVHEINNPLSGVLNYIRLMTRILRRGPLPDDRREKFMKYLDLVENETDRCSHIVSSLLAFSRKSPPSFGPVNVEELLQRSIALSQHKLKLQNIELDSRIDSGLPDVEGDFNQLQQCVINLVFNAIDAMPEGGTLTLSGSYQQAQNRVLIVVNDTGQGIAPDDLPHIFEPFFTTKKEGYGVGLGLSTLYGIIQRHDGAVDVQSHSGQGTTFTLQLPVNAEKMPANRQKDQDT